MTGAARVSTLVAAAFVRSASRPSSTSASTSSTSLSSSIQSWRFTAPRCRQIRPEARGPGGRPGDPMSRCSSPTDLTSARSRRRSSGCMAAPCWSSYPAAPGRGPSGHARTRVDAARPDRREPRPRDRARLAQPAERRRRDSTACRRPAPPATAAPEQCIATGEHPGHRAAEARVLPGERHGSLGRHRIADDDHLAGVDDRVDRPREQRPAQTSTDALSTPSRRAARPPARTTAVKGLH